RLQDAQKLDDLFDKMLKLRHQVALNAGFPNYMEYKFKAMHRFDYGPEDSRQYHSSMKEFLVPLWRKILDNRRRQMKLDVLRPWDTAVDPLGRPPLKPFTKTEELIKGCQNIFNRVDPELGQQFRDMSGLGLLDLDSRKGKAPGGYQSALSEARKQFIFMNAVGTDDDVRTLLHEGGHAFHTFAAADYFLPAYRHAPMEFCEVASMTMELFADGFLNEFYSDDDRKRSVAEHLEGIVYVLIWVAIVDSFQHWIYQHPQHTQAERKEKWISIQKDFGTGLVSWEGLESEQAYLWHRQLHIFEVPFYYIEYGIAQMGALQLWLKSKKDFQGTVLAYRRALALGGSQSLPKLFEAAGLTFDFSSRTIGPLAKSLSQVV
ncbi:MAG: M3 family oligoendopeptidase, partial [Sedimentisphaerales bacterium]|nr:M3 family oligoendopeptidase [Sedimentisphaerales bacterium]